MTFARLRPSHWLAFAAALALLLVMATTWWTNQQSEQLNSDAAQVAPQLNRDVSPTPSDQARAAAAAMRKNPWQETAAIDRLVLLALLAAAAAAIAAAFMRAANRARPGRTGPSGLASIAGLIATILVAYRIIEPPGLHAAAIVKAGAPLGLACVGILTIASRAASAVEPEPVAAPEEVAPPAAAGAGV